MAHGFCAFSPLCSTAVPFLRIIFSNVLCRPMTAAGCLGGTPWDVRSLQPPVTRESLVQRVSQIRFSAMALVLPSATETFSLPGAIRQPSGLVTHTASSEFAIFYMARHRSRWALRVPTDPGPCHACRDEGGHLVAHLGQGLGSRISARQANKATLGPVPCHVVMMHLDASANLDARLVVRYNC